MQELPHDQEYDTVGIMPTAGELAAPHAERDWEQQC